MSVYIVFDGGYEDEYIVGVYAYLEDAMHSHGHHEWSLTSGTSWKCGHVTNHKTGTVPIDQPITLDTVTVPVVDGKATLPNGNVITVDSGQTHVVVPIPPKVDWVREWQTYCDYRIEEHALVSARVPA